MQISKIRSDGIFEGIVEVPDGTKTIPSGHSFSLPPEIPLGHFAYLNGTWKISKGEKPDYPLIEYDMEEIVSTVELVKEVDEDARIMFPQNAVIGEKYESLEGVKYLYDGNQWSIHPIST
jgi:hypothetical protein